jgi:hypothetical protein
MKCSELSRLTYLSLAVGEENDLSGIVKSSQIQVLPGKFVIHGACNGEAVVESLEYRQEEFRAAIGPGSLHFQPPLFKTNDTCQRAQL